MPFYAYLLPLHVDPYCFSLTIIHGFAAWVQTLLDGDERMNLKPACKSCPDSVKKKKKKNSLALVYIAKKYFVRPEFYVVSTAEYVFSEYRPVKSLPHRSLSIPPSSSDPLETWPICTPSGSSTSLSGWEGIQSPTFRTKQPLENHSKSAGGLFVMSFLCATHVFWIFDNVLSGITSVLEFQIPGDEKRTISDRAN